MSVPRAKPAKVDEKAVAIGIAAGIVDAAAKVEETGAGTAEETVAASVRRKLSPLRRLPPKPSPMDPWKPLPTPPLQQRAKPLLRAPMENAVVAAAAVEAAEVVVYPNRSTPA
jgi:hypothetical protein